MKIDEHANKMHAHLFSDNQRVGCAEQLAKGGGNFANLFEQAPVESHDLESNNIVTCRLRLKKS